jgi:hypothetical protein
MVYGFDFITARAEHWPTGFAIVGVLSYFLLCFTSIGVLSADKDVNPTMSLK